MFMQQVAVIENEYGEVGIDDALVMESKEEVRAWATNVDQNSPTRCRAPPTDSWVALEVPAAYKKASGGGMEVGVRGHACPGVP